MKYFLVILSALLFSCTTSIVPVDISNVETNNSAEEQLVKNQEMTVSEINNLDVVSAVEFGAKGDAIQREDINIQGRVLSLSEAVFKSSDVGKIFSVARAGEDGEHLTGVIEKIIDAQRVLISTKAENNVSNALGSIGTDNIVYLQRAVDYVIAKNKRLLVPEGIYLLGDRNSETDQTSVRINMTKPNQNLVLLGEGKGKTIFRELDGKTQRLGRYTKMFYHYLKNSPDIGTIYISDLSFDKNGRSLTKNPKTFYEWEQAHCFGWAMATKEQSPGFITKIHLENIEIVDKIGAGINFSSGPTKVNSFKAEGISESEFNGNVGSILYGQRGDLELSCFSEDIFITDSKLRYVQIEPVRTFSSDASNQRFCKITNSSIYSLDYAESDNKDPRYSKLEVENLVSEQVIIRSLYFRIKDSDIRIPKLINSVDGAIINSKIRLPYDSLTNSITPVNSSYLRTLGAINNKMIFDSCIFDIENNTPDLTPKGAAIKASGKVKNLNQNVISVINCTFDQRLETSIDGYANGKWLLENNTLAGRSQAIIAGSYREFMSDVTLLRNNYDRLEPNIPKVRINNNNTLWSITADQSNLEENLFLLIKGSQGDIKKQIRFN